MTNTPTQSEAQVALLPCPFCGCQRVTLWRTDNPHGRFVSCANCGCCTPESIGVNDLAGMDAATSKWNYRCMPREFGEDATPAVPTPAAKRHSQPTVEGEAVADATIKNMAMLCARHAYGYWQGDSTGQGSALAYWGDGMGADGRARMAEPYEQVIRYALSHPPHPQQSVAMDEEVMCEACKGSGEGPIVNVGDGEPYWDRQTSCAPCKGTGVIIRATPVGKVCDDFLRGVSQQSVAVPEGLIDALRHQRQVDADGSECGVSRQAVDEAIGVLLQLSAAPQPPPPQVKTYADGLCEGWDFCVAEDEGGLNEAMKSAGFTPQPPHSVGQKDGSK